MGRFVNFGIYASVRNIVPSLDNWHIECSKLFESPMVSPDEFKFGMRHLAGAVSIITSRIDGKPAGMTATAVCSLTMDPPVLLVCINKDATSHGPISDTKRFTVNCLSTDDDALARHFCIGDMDARFQVGEWLDAPSGGIVLKTALATFDCCVTQQIEVSTHSIFLGLVEHVAVATQRWPLVYFNGRYGGVTVHSPTEAGDVHRR